MQAESTEAPTGRHCTARDLAIAIVAAAASVVVVVGGGGGGGGVGLSELRAPSRLPIGPSALRRSRSEGAFGAFLVGERCANYRKTISWQKSIPLGIQHTIRAPARLRHCNSVTFSPQCRRPQNAIGHLAATASAGPAAEAAATGG